MVTTKEELLAAHICKQITFLEGLLSELESEPMQDKNIMARIRSVESQMRELRSQL